MFKAFFSRLRTLDTPPPWGALSALNAVLAGLLAVFLGTTIAIALLGDKAQYVTLFGWTVGGILMIAFIYFTRRKPEERAALRISPAEAVPDRLTTVQNILLLMLIGVGLAIALDVVTIRVTGLSIPGPELYRPYYDVYAENFPVPAVTWVLAVALMVIVQPIVDQLLFQGIVLPALRQALGALPGYLITAALYGLFHLIVYSSPDADPAVLWYALFVPFIAGLIFGAVRLYTGSTRAAMLTHVAFGLFAVVKLLTLVA